MHAQLCLPLCNRMDCSLPCSSIRGIFQAIGVGCSSSGLPFPSPGDPPEPGIEPRSPVFQAVSLPSEPPGSGRVNNRDCKVFKALSIYYLSPNRDKFAYIALENCASM